MAQADIDSGEIVNVASAAGASPGGDPVVSADDSVTVPGPAVSGTLTLDKSSTDTAYAAVGDVIDYEFLVTNTGAVTLTNVAVADDRIDEPAECAVAVLAPTEAVTCTGSHVVTAADVTAGEFVNVASATATDPSGTALASEQDAATVLAAAPPARSIFDASIPGLSGTGGAVSIGVILLSLLALLAGALLATRRRAVSESRKIHR